MNDEPDRLADLRQRAEARLKPEVTGLPDLSPEQACELIHELRTHQVELEMQNEELRRAQEELVASRDRYTALYEYAPAGYVSVSPKGLILEANLTLAGMLGVERRELIQQPLANFVVPEDTDALYLCCRRILASKQRDICHVRMHRRDAVPLSVEMDSVLIEADDGSDTRLQTAITDITERLRLEREVVHLERMRATTELAAGVSHNLNNMLTAVLGPAQLLLRCHDDPQVHQEAEAILTAGRRASDLVERLSRAVRASQGELTGSVCLNRQVREVVELSRHRWQDEPAARGVSIEVVTELGETPDIIGDPDELDDVILNMVLNAVQAMPEGGSLTLTTRTVDAGVQLTVRDTGIGMDAETCRRVFEPFFTTKLDVGSGLGMSMVHGTVSRWGGTIEVASTAGQGSTFTLWFPASTVAVASEDPAAAAVTSVRSGRLLVVEDDEGVGQILDRLLSPTHAVEVMADGREALERFVPGRYDVALIDLGLPGLSGDQVAAQMRLADPSVATVLVTGWVLAPDDTRRRRFDFQIQKPFGDLDEVEAVVAQAIELHDSRT